jgi:hypothetical protein
MSQRISRSGVLPDATASPDRGGLCRSCALTRTCPADSEGAGLAYWSAAEAAKRRLIFELLELHIRDVLQTAIAYALNEINRSLGEPDLYPFVLAPAVIDKLAFIDSLVRAYR